MLFVREGDIFEHIIVARNDEGQATWEADEDNFGVVFCQHCNKKLTFWFDGGRAETIEDHLQETHTDIFFELLLTDALEEVGLWEQE